MTTILAIALLGGAFVAGFLTAAILASGKAEDAYRRGLKDGNPILSLKERLAALKLETATWRDGTE